MQNHSPDRPDDKPTQAQIDLALLFAACLELVDEGIGTMQGGTYAMTDSGLTMLVGGGDRDLDVR